MNSLFDVVPTRRGTLSYKWDTTPSGVLPMWVADMDFPTAPCVREAVERRVAHGVFGYTAVPESYYQATANWFDRRHGWRPERSYFIYTSGVVPAISAIIKAMTRPGDGVAVLTPVFNCFFSSIRNNGCQALQCPLVVGADGMYMVDWDSLESIAAQPATKILLLCNPHNPGGRVWTRDELLRMADIAARHRLFVISDEIHCELTYPGHAYTPYASLGADVAAGSAVCISPSKAFNIAGLQIASIVAPDPEVRARIDRAININEVCDVNPLGPVATVAAYTDGAAWLDSLRGYLHENFRALCGYMSSRHPEIAVMPLDSTYLAWLDMRATGLDSHALDTLFVEKGRVRLSPGDMFGEGGDGFMRLNFACPREALNEGLARVSTALSKL